MKATHEALEIIVNNDTIDEQSEEMLRALLKVGIKPSANPRYTTKMQDAMRRVQLRLDEIEEGKKDKTNWNRISLWIGLAGLLIAALTYCLPQLSQK